MHIFWDLRRLWSARKLKKRCDQERERERKVSFWFIQQCFATSRFPNTYFFVKALKRLERSILSFTRCYVIETIRFNVFSSPYDEPLFFFFLNVHGKKSWFFFFISTWNFWSFQMINNQKLKSVYRVLKIRKKKINK